MDDGGLNEESTEVCRETGGDGRGILFTSRMPLVMVLGSERETADNGRYWISVTRNGAGRAISDFSTLGDEAPSVSVDCWRSVLDEELLIDDRRADEDEKLRLGMASFSLVNCFLSAASFGFSWFPDSDRGSLFKESFAALEILLPIVPLVQYRREMLGSGLPYLTVEAA